MSYASLHKVVVPSSKFGKVLVLKVGKVFPDVVRCFRKEVGECEEGEEWRRKESNGKGAGSGEDRARETGDKDVDKPRV